MSGMERFTSIVDKLEQSARRFPDRIAIVQGAESVCYADLWQRVCRRAAWLCDEGLAPGDRVALILENSPEYVITYYATLAAGGVIVPLNAAAKSRDFGIWLAHSDAIWLFCSPGNPDIDTAIRESATRPRVVHPDRSAEVLMDLPIVRERQVDTHQNAASAAAIVYTSGTTGAPKGVLLTHGNLAYNCTAIVRYLQLSETDSIVCVLPFYYSYGNSVLHTHLQVGACVIIETSLVYPHAVVATLAAQRATGFAGVPSTFLLLLGRVALEKFDLSALRYVTQAGGAMPHALALKLRQALPQADLFVMYGQTEATARLTYLRPQDLDRKPGSVGVPIDGVNLEVRNESGTVCAADEEGEVWVRGPNVMSGYWRNIEATQSVLQGGWLKTGDMGHIDAEGYLFLAGRRSDMIKTGAHRVHPNDVEEAILELDEVDEVAVVGVDDEVLGQAIKAFIVAASGGSVDPMSVKAHCRRRLANYKIPKHIELVDALPRTASGKVRRHELLHRNSA